MPLYTAAPAGGQGKTYNRPMERAVPILPADDLSVARQFYVDKLGFRVTFEAGDGKSGIIGVERGTTQDEYWGARTFSVHDPSDNTIFVIGPIRDARP